MNKSVRRLIVIGCFIIGFITSAIAWAVPLTPNWLNTYLFVFGVVLETGALIYIFIRFIRRITQ